MKKNPIITIQTAKKEDISDIHRLLRELANDTGMDKKMISTTDDLLKYGFTEGRHFHSLLAKHENNSIGLCLYFYNFSSWMGAPGIFIQDLFVTKKYRRLDIGKKLLYEVIAQNEKEEITHISLNVDHKNTKAKKFYEKLGFRHRKEEHNYFIETETLKTLKPKK